MLRGYESDETSDSFIIVRNKNSIRGEINAEHQYLMHHQEGDNSYILLSARKTFNDDSSLVINASTQTSLLDLLFPDNAISKEYILENNNYIDCVDLKECIQPSAIENVGKDRTYPEQKLNPVCTQVIEENGIFSV